MRVRCLAQGQLRPPHPTQRARLADMTAAWQADRLASGRVIAEPDQDVPQKGHGPSAGTDLHVSFLLFLCGLKLDDFQVPEAGLKLRLQVLGDTFAACKGHCLRRSLVTSCTSTSKVLTYRA